MAARTKKTDTAQTTEQVATPSYVMPAPVVLRLDALTPDPTNARLHDEPNLAAIRKSLAAFGQRTPLVIQKNRHGAMIIRKGNGTYEAARRLGWEQLACVVYDEDDSTAVAYAIADNRTGELSTWDDVVLAQLLSATRGADDAELFGATGFSEAHHDALLESLAQQYDPGEEEEGEEQRPDDVLSARIVITCPLDVADEVRAALNTLKIPGVEIK